jgi:hypothetical protein
MTDAGFSRQDRGNRVPDDGILVRLDRPQVEKHRVLGDPGIDGRGMSAQPLGELLRGETG